MLKLSLTTTCPGKSVRGGYHQPVNTANGGLACTLNTRYEAIGCNNIITLAHYPMTVVLFEYDL